MYENVVAIHLARQFRARGEIYCRQAEDRFYEQFSEPLPRWLTGPILLLGGRRTARSGIAAAPSDPVDGPQATREACGCADLSSSIRNCCTS